MNFPLEQPLFQFFYWLVNTPGMGAGVVGLVVGTALVLFAATLRWIHAAREIGSETYLTPPEKQS